MTRREAIEYNNEIKQKLEKTALLCKLEESIGAYIVDNYIEIMPEDTAKGMIFLGDESASYKIGNIRLDIKKALIAALEFTVSISGPENIFNYIQLIIVTAFFIEKSAKQELNLIQAYIVYWLHINGMYQKGLEEETFINKMQQWYQEKNYKDFEREKITEAISQLYKINIIDIENGIIYLKESVWGSI